jgi:S-adenosylmethionine decarboxylase
MIGQLLVIDAKVVKDRIDDKRHIEHFAKALIAECGLTVRSMSIEEFTNGSDFGPGITLTAILTESHLAIHTAPNRQNINIDLFSCKEINILVIKELISGFFPGIEYTRCALLDRK